MKCKVAHIILLICVLLVSRTSINAQTAENLLAANWYKRQIILFKQSSAPWSLTAAETRLINSKSASPFNSCSTAATSICPVLGKPATSLVLQGQRNSADIVTLKWETQAEYNNKGFILERAVTGFNSYDSVFYAIGAGTSDSKSKYQHIDQNGYERSSFYRIKQMDNNGNFSYSNVVEIKGANLDFFVNVIPNPARSSNIRIYFGVPAISKTVDFTIVNSLGVQVLKKDKFIATTGYYEFKDGHFLPPGLYFVTARTSNGLYTKSFVISD